MDKTENLQLPYLMAAQAQKHVTHNEALRALDALVQLSVLSQDLTAPPASPSDGDRYIVAGGAIDDWSGKENQLAAWQDNSWMFYVPQTGWLCWISDENKVLVFDGTTWDELSGAGATNPAPLIGINTTASNPNKLAVKSDAVLFSHDDITPGNGSMQIKINKAAPNKTATFLFQDGFSGRAEIGLTGDDNFHFKVSGDGANWKEGIVIDKDDGSVTFPANLYAESAAFNLMGDGGRFAGSPEPVTATATTFAKPGWLRASGGAVISEHGKFYRNSASYGGAGTALDADIKQLVDQIISAGYRRYYPEFFVAKLVAGSTVGYSPTFPDGISRYTAFYTEGYMRPVSMTFSYYLKVKSGDIGLPKWGTQTTFLDGVLQNNHFVVPNDGNWHHILIMESADFTDSYRYDNNSIRGYMRDSHEILMAFPAAIPGLLKLPTNIGQVPGTKAW